MIHTKIITLENLISKCLNKIFSLKAIIHDVYFLFIVFTLKNTKLLNLKEKYETTKRLCL